MSAGALSERTRASITIGSLLALVMFAVGATAGYYNSRDALLQASRVEVRSALSDYPTRLELERARSEDFWKVQNELGNIRRELVNLRISIEALKRR